MANDKIEISEENINKVMDTVKKSYDNEFTSMIYELILMTTFTKIPAHHEPGIRVMSVTNYIKNCPNQILAIKYAEWAKEMIDKAVKEWKGQ